MTVALVLTAEPAAGLSGQLTSLGVRRVDATEDAGPGGGLLTIAAAARATSEPMLICAGGLSVPRQALARLHALAAADLTDDRDSLGRPAPEAAGRLDTLAWVLAVTSAPCHRVRRRVSRSGCSPTTRCPSSRR